MERVNVLLPVDLGERQKLSSRQWKPDAQAKFGMSSILRVGVRLRWVSFFLPVALWQNFIRNRAVIRLNGGDAEQFGTGVDRMNLGSLWQAGIEIQLWVRHR